MGNSGSSSSGRRSRRSSNSNRRHPAAPPLPPPTPPQPQQPEVAGNRYVFAAATPYPNPNPNPNPNPYYQSPGYYPPPPLPAPLDHHHQHGPPHVPFLVEHQKAITIRNDVNIKKETLRVVPDEQNPGRFLVAFTFDANFAGRITIFFFAKEDYDCNLKSTKDLLLPVTVHFKEGLAQEFLQPPGTGIDFTKFEDGDLVSEGEMEVYPLAVKAEALPDDTQGAVDKPGTPNLQITQAVFEKEKNGNYHVRVVKQILWVSERRYELQEIYGIGNSIDGDFGNDPGKECVICLSEPRDTAILPCRHMCLCGECATVLKLQTNRCPICRQPVERLLEIKVSEEESPEDAKSDPIPSRD